MSSLWSPRSARIESEVVKWSGRLPQLQSCWGRKETSWNCPKITKNGWEQQTSLCAAVEAFLTLTRCGIYCEYALTCVFQTSFSTAVCVCVCVCVCDLPWDLKERTMTAREQRTNCPPGKNVTLQSDSCGSEPLLRPNYNSRWRGQRRNFIVGRPCVFFSFFFLWWGVL